MFEIVELGALFGFAVASAYVFVITVPRIDV